MIRKKHTFLAYAVALTAGMSVFPMPVHAESPESAAAETAAEGGKVLAGIKESPMVSATAIEPSSTMVSPSQVAETSGSVNVVETEQSAGVDNTTGTHAEGTQPSAKSTDERTAEWERTRPKDTAFMEETKAYEGQTVVDIQFPGAGEYTEPTARASVFMHPGDVFSAKLLEQDLDAIFRTGYFYDLYPSFEQVPEGVVVTYHLLENPILNDIVIIGNESETTEALMKRVTMPMGEILNSVELRENVMAIQEKYREDGYILAKIMDMDIDREGVLTLKINEGILEGYKVKGNKKTRDKVILREMRQKPGTPFNAKLARRSMQRVYNLGFFEDVNIKMNPGVEPNAVVMELDVKEKRTGTFGIGAGYSSADGFIAMASVSDTNFRGMGDAVSLTYEHSGSESDAHGYTFSYRHPWLDSKETGILFRLYNRTYKYNDYDTSGDLKEEYMRKYAGGEITLSRPVSEYATNYITIRNRKDKYVRHISDGNMGDRSTPAWEDWRKANFGTTRSIIFEHVSDTRDNVYDPTSGSKLNLSVEVAGFGGDFDFQKYTAEGQRYYKLGHAQVLALRGKVGFGHGEISEFNQYRLGGQGSLRGYRDDQFRGNRVLGGTVEYRFPLHKKVTGAIFTDFGSAWNTGFRPKDFHGSIGVGVALTTPLGPLRLDYGYGSQGGRFHFSVGGMF